MFTYKRRVKLSRIKVPERFTSTVPKPEKVIQKTADFLMNGKRARIHVDKNFVLFDDYITYLILKEFKVKKARVLVCSEKYLSEVKT